MGNHPVPSTNPSDSSYQAKALPPPYSELGATPTAGSGHGAVVGALNVAASSTLPPHQGHPPIVVYSGPPRMPVPNVQAYPNSPGPMIPPGPYQGGLAFPAYPHPNHHFGPTPINQQQILLPYAWYSERGLADARARQRFVEAVLVACGVYFGVALLFGNRMFGDGGWFTWADFERAARATV